MHSATRSTRRRGAGTSLILGTLLALGAFLATPAQAQLNLNKSGTPDDGVACLTGYTGSISGSAFVCTKTTRAEVNLECRGQFPKYVVRALGSAGTPDGRDLCTRAGLNLGATETTAGLIPGTDYVKADVGQASADSAAAAVHKAEVAALGLTRDDVDANAQAPTLDLNANGSKDKARVGIKLFTFAAPRTIAISARQ